MSGAFVPLSVFGTQNCLMYSMKNFTTGGVEFSGKAQYHMYIGFSDQPSGDNGTMNCYGTALVWIDGKKGCLFEYCFDHSSDWNEISEMILRPAKRYKLPQEKVWAVGGAIVKNIL